MYGMSNKIGLVGYGSMMGEGSFQKPYSDHTNWEIDEEVRNLVREQYALTRDLLMEHKDKIQALGDQLLDKETMNLPMIIDILGDRPYGMNEAASKYLDELNERKDKEDKEAAEKEVNAAETELSKSLDDNQAETAEKSEGDSQEKPDAEAPIIEEKGGEDKSEENKK